MPRSLSAISNLEIRDLNRDQVRFYHPGYLKPLNLLFCLPRVDYEPLRGAWGVHYRTALTACQIIANNAFGTGRLARDERGKDIVADDDQILLNRDYWFFIDGEGISLTFYKKQNNTDLLQTDTLLSLVSETGNSLMINCPTGGLHPSAQPLFTASDAPSQTPVMHSHGLI